jgi:hypothetical protein
MEHADIIVMLDKKYAAEPVPCSNEGVKVKSQNGNAYDAHGNLQVHRSAAQLVCGRCGANQPISRL